jgi:choline dehydrogenase
MADLRLLLQDRMLLRVALGGVAATIRTGVERVGDLLRAILTARLLPGLDPNHWETLRRNRPGITRIPLAVTPDGRRAGPKERLLRLLDEASPHKIRLHLRTGFCVTGLVSKKNNMGDRSEDRIVGVMGLPREHVYEADPHAKESAVFPEEEVVRLYCRREVILCGGTLNTPQLLLLSGIGPKDHLEEIGIPLMVDLPGVGLNLQDRYEVAVNAIVTDRFRSFDGLSWNLDQPDRWLNQWIQNPGRSAFQRGLYSNTGALMGLFLRSKQEEVFPDLFTFVILGSFGGYHVGYSCPSIQLPKVPGDPPGHRRTLTWLILKARTRNRGGYVRLQSRNPLQRPEVNFRFFHNGQDADLEAIHEGVEFVDSMLHNGKAKGTIHSHSFPGASEFNDDLREWIKNTAWGHHACGTCRMGIDNDPMAVVDSRFRVRWIAGLRIVDASVFPRIPGFFVAASIYTIAEKAADVIAEDHPLASDSLPPEVRAELVQAPIYPSRQDVLARQAYPAAMERAEAELIAIRRRAAKLGG